ncbi:MAG: hypothetical protein AB7E95_12720 [Kiritimatiellales bacterium]
MKIPVQRYLIPGLATCCALAAVAMIPVFHLPRSADGSDKNGMRTIPSPDMEALNREPPPMQSVVTKHLFIPQRTATGQNSFPDLVVKGVFLGDERSVVFSLKSKPQADLRVWEGGVDKALSQIIDPRDPRQPISQFLKEWNIKEIRFDGVQVEHFITGEVETYAVDYTPLKKVKDDAARGYGQGIIPQGGGGTQMAAAGRSGNNAKNSSQAKSKASAQPVNQVADRVSAMVQRMSPAQQKQFLQRIQQNSSKAGQSKNKSSAKNSSAQNKSASSRTNKTPTKKK